jgi:hypothetical protein
MCIDEELARFDILTAVTMNIASLLVYDAV